MGTQDNSLHGPLGSGALPFLTGGTVGVGQVGGSSKFWPLEYRGKGQTSGTSLPVPGPIWSEDARTSGYTSKGTCLPVVERSLCMAPLVIWPLLCCALYKMLQEGTAGMKAGSSGTNSAQVRGAGAALPSYLAEGGMS